MLRSTPCQQVISARSYDVSTGKQAWRILHRRIMKAERDERVDLTAALTPIRTYRGGFTRPTDIRASNWFPGGRYHTMGKVYEEPSPFAYEPHTVLLLESRYDIKYGIGRKDHPAHIVAVCRTADLEAVIKSFNSRLAPGDCLQYMDNARWPWLKPKKTSHVKWWNSPEEREETLQDLKDDATAVGHQAVQDALQQASRESDEEDLRAKKDFRRQLAQTTAVAARVTEEQQLSDIATEIKPLQGKVPFELEFEDGTVAHPSGFVPPTPADRQHDPEYHLSPHPHSRVATELRRRQMETVNEHHSDSLVPRIEQWKALKERQDEEGGLMQSLTTGILSGGVSAATEPRDAKIPTEIHGVHDNAIAQPMQHPSGFVPPTARMSRGASDARTSIVEGENSDSGEAPEAPERSPTFASSDTHHVEEGYDSTTKADPEESRKNLIELRKTYFDSIKTTPFWRPLLCMTVSTRPLAKTLARLSRGLTRGQAFYSVIPPGERMAQRSLASRLRSLRITRMRTLATEMAQLLAGARGGFIGLRFDAHSRGRGIDGEGLDKPIPWEQRVIGVGIGSWYHLADELVESFKLIAEQEVSEVYEIEGENRGPFLVYKMDEHGVPVADSPQFPWPAMDKMDDNVRAGLDAIRIAKKMERLLDLHEDRIGKVLSVTVSNNDDGREPHHAIPDHNSAITIRFVEDEKWPEPKGNELRGTWARGALKKRLDNFYGEHADNIALATAMHAPGVVYPPYSRNTGLVKMNETYLLEAEDDLSRALNREDFGSGNLQREGPAHVLSE
ncbi:hypothetical protein BT96DRAFT_857103 [Gymnopus androsaceus JB14]|uniref:Uncharacterized protein n=1 Tax=Gymnopus androsaceus JB14 TaxID=1447944 RepID=A0A6A4HUN3_9AGAR|nr:hypothetical protein BT96DRAFT_857103 [Gymnopus androsaceus JB14]